MAKKPAVPKRWRCTKRCFAGGKLWIEGEFTPTAMVEPPGGSTHFAPVEPVAPPEPEEPEPEPEPELEE